MTLPDNETKERYWCLCHLGTRHKDWFSFWNRGPEGNKDQLKLVFEGGYHHYQSETTLGKSWWKCYVLPLCTWNGVRRILQMLWKQSLQKCFEIQKESYDIGWSYHAGGQSSHQQTKTSAQDEDGGSHYNVAWRHQNIMDMDSKAKINIGGMLEKLTMF